MRIILGLLIATLLIFPATAQFPSHEDVVDRLAAAAETAPEWITLETVGESGQGRELQLAIITDPASAVPMEDRVVTLLLTQQHGNEPAGTPAVLRLVDDIAAGTYREHLQNQILLVQPMGNPDGAFRGSRGNDAGVDLNRDHVHLEQPETQIVHQLFNNWDIHVGVDHHEYSGTGIGSPIPVRTYDYDATILFPRHGNVRDPVVEAAADLMDNGMTPAAEERGYTVGDYGTITAAGIPIQHVAGGPDPGILRNNFGLNNIAGLLVESFVPPGINPTIDGDRRADVHHAIMEGTLSYVSANADAFIEAKREAERLNLEEPLDQYIEAWPDHPVTGEHDDRNIMSPLASMYGVSDPIEHLMALHGLPVPIYGEGAGAVYTLETERAGLVAAILHPESSRNAVSSVVVAGLNLPPAEVSAEESTPTLPLVLLVVAILVVARRST